MTANLRSEAPFEVAIDEIVERACADWGIVGCAVAVIAGRRPVYCRGLGVRRIGESDPVGPDTLFQIGSLTKSFTAVALAMLKTRGELDWDDKVRRLVPELEFQSAEVAQKLTIRDVLTHASGLGDYLLPYLAPTPAESLVGHLRQLPVEKRLRASYSYNNQLYGLAGEIVARISGETWHSFMQSRIIAPLGMSRTCTTPYAIWDRKYVTPAYLGSAALASPRADQCRAQDVAMPHAYSGDREVALAWQSYDYAAAAGSVVSTARDLVNWLLLQLGDAPLLLSREAIAELHAIANPAPSTSLTGVPWEGERYGMGWRVSGYAGQRHLSHGGAMVGFPAYAAMLPASGHAIAILTNGPKQPAGGGPGAETLFHRGVAYDVFDRLLDLPDSRWRQRLRGLAARPAHEEEAADGPVELSSLAPDCVGTFRERSSGVALELSEHGGRLVMAFLGGGLRADLIPVGKNTFGLALAPGVRDVLGRQTLEICRSGTGAVRSLQAFGFEFEPVAAGRAPSSE